MTERERELEKSLTSEQRRALVSLNRPEVYAICLDRTVGRELENMGLAEWLPPVWGNTPHWGITDAGRALLSRTEEG